MGPMSGNGATRNAGDDEQAAVGALAADIARGMATVAPAGWIHIRADVAPSGRGDAFAVLPQESQWIEVPAPVSELARRHRAIAGPWAALRIDIDPGQPAVLQARPHANAGPDRFRAGCIAISAVCAVATMVFALLVLLRPDPTVIPVDVAPPVSAEQFEAEQLVRDWYDNDKDGDPTWLRQLVCAEPTGRVLDELTLVESGAARHADVRIEGFTDFVDHGATAQIRVYYTAHPRPAEAAQQVADRKEGFFIWTFVFTRDNGALRLCGG